MTARVIKTMLCLVQSAPTGCEYDTDCKWTMCSGIYFPKRIELCDIDDWEPIHLYHTYLSLNLLNFLS